MKIFYTNSSMQMWVTHGPTVGASLSAHKQKAATAAKMKIVTNSSLDCEQPVKDTERSSVGPPTRTTVGLTCSIEHCAIFVIHHRRVVFPKEDLDTGFRPVSPLLTTGKSPRPPTNDREWQSRRNKMSIRHRVVPVRKARYLVRYADVGNFSNNASSR
jgi:hypothetical protein